MEHRAPTAEEPSRADAVVLKLNRHSARIRIVGEAEQVTLRAENIHSVVPGHVVALAVAKRWAWRGDAYAAAKLEGARIDVPKLGLEPLPLEGGELDDVRDYTEPYTGSDFYSKFWKKRTATPRPAYEFDGIAWGAFPDADPEDNPTCDAAELREVGRHGEARELLMDTLGRDLRVLDAHAGLGNMEFDFFPQRALVHYEIGVRIGELSLPPGFDGYLPWGRIHNRAFLRCLHGYALALWRLGDMSGAKRAFERIASYNPTDHQGVRFCLHDVRAGRSWEEMNARDEAAAAKRRRALH
jgi:hypothetical protein